MSPLQQNATPAYLITEQNRRWSDVYRLTEHTPTVIGRSSSCQIVLVDDRCSRNHAKVEFSEGKWVVEDLGSRNGTRVDGQPIAATHRLEDGQQIQIGGAVLRFSYSLGATVSGTAQGILADSAKKEFHATAEIGEIEPLIVQRATPRRWVTEMSVAMLSCSSLAESTALALKTMTERCQIHAGAILLTDQSDVTKVLATLEREGKAYHRISDFVVKTCLSEKRAILARNIQNDQQFVDASSSLNQKSTSIICVPIFDAQDVFALIHLYSRDDESELNASALDEISAAAEALSVTIPHLRLRGKLHKQLVKSRRQVHALQLQLDAASGPNQMLGKSPALQRLQSQIARVAVTEANVLLRGESGVGKELAARQIHQLSDRKNKPFVAVNCAALTATLLESELFGHEKGAFTGATEQKIGKFEMANGGTLMLDEVGEMSAEIQAKFLRVLEGQPFERVGGSKPISVDVRIVAATNRDLEQAVKENQFRADLYFRLRVVEIHLPSLRDRRDDILPLAEHFLHTFRNKSGYGPSGFSARARSAMENYNWPGNIRELKNSVERAFVLANGDLAEPEDLALSNLAAGLSQANNVSAAPQVYEEKSLAQVEQEHILATLDYTEGQKSRAASILGIERSTLDRKLKRFMNESDSDDDATNQDT